MITWNIRLAAMRAWHNLKLKFKNKKRKKRQAASVKPEDLHAANTISFKHLTRDPR